MMDGFVHINRVPTHILTWGQWIEDNFNKSKSLILIISGNPGLPGFYSKFGATLYEELDKKVPVWVIGQAGHDEPNKDLQMKTPPLKGNEDLYDLQGQLNHKIDFINQFIPKDIKIFMIGHSVGARLCLDILKTHKEFSEQVEHVYLMFPTIERIAESKKGELVPTFNKFFFLVRFLYNFLAILPLSWRRAIVKWQSGREGVGVEFLDTSMEYTNPRVIDRVWFLALDEMDKIRDLDEETIKINLHRLKLYYGLKDDWVKTEFYHDLIEKFPEIDAQLCAKDYEHAFVLKSSLEVGKMVAEWIDQKLRIKN